MSCLMGLLGSSVAISIFAADLIIGHYGEMRLKEGAEAYPLGISFT